MLCLFCYIVAFILIPLISLNYTDLRINVQNALHNTLWLMYNSSADSLFYRSQRFATFKKICQCFPPEETQPTTVLEIALTLLWARYEFVLFNLVLVQQEMHKTVTDRYTCWMGKHSDSHILLHLSETHAF